MSKQDLLKTQTCVLKVSNIHCEGCKRKLKKLLRKTNGVYSTSIDAEHGKVTVIGNVDPATLIKKLEKSGKHAELWGPPQKAPSNLEVQLKNIQLDSSNVHKEKKAPKGAQKFPQELMKGPKELVIPLKDQETVKFDGGNFEDDLYDDSGEEEFEVEEHHISPSSKTVIVKGDGNAHAPGNIRTNKSDHDQTVVKIPVVAEKDANGRDSFRGHQKNHGGFLGFGGLFRGNSKKGGKSVVSTNKEIKRVKESRGKIGATEGVSHSQICGEKKIDKKEASKNDGALDVNGVKEVIQEIEVGHSKDKGGEHGGGVERAQKGQMGDYPMDKTEGKYPMGQTAAPIQGMQASAAANNVSYQGAGRDMDMGMGQSYQGAGGGMGMGMGQGSPFEQQHHMFPSMNPMMTHQWPNGGHDMHQHMMHGRPYPHGVNYVPPMPPPGADPHTLYFSDENPNGCSIM